MIDEKRLIKDCEERLLVGTNVIKMIEEQPKISEWIPIAEKLPEPGEYILLSFENFIQGMRTKAMHQLAYL